MCYGYSTKIDPAITTPASVLAKAGASRAEVCTSCPSAIDSGNRPSNEAIERAYSSIREQAQTPRTTDGEPLATPKQVEFIMTLIHRGAHEEGGYMTGPTIRDGVAAMGRREASAYIDSLTGRY